MTALPSCACGQQIPSEKAAQEHAKTCGLQGYPRGWDASRVWVAGHWTEAS